MSSTEWELDVLRAERDALRAEIDRLHSWNGLMELLDEHWPDELVPTLEDISDRDPGPRIVSLLRWVRELRAKLDAAPHAPDCARLFPMVFHAPFPCTCWKRTILEGEETS